MGRHDQKESQLNAEILEALEALPAERVLEWWEGVDRSRAKRFAGVRGSEKSCSCTLP